MKHPFRPSKSNIIYASIVAFTIMLLNIRIYGFDYYRFGYIVGSIIGILLIPTVIALLFWFLLGRKEKGGTTTFNLLLTFMFIGSLSELGQIAEERQNPVNDLKKAISDFKETSLAHPDSTNTTYLTLSNNVTKSIDELVKTSFGEEKKVYLALQEYFIQADSINIKWNNAHKAFAEPRILDFARLNEKNEFDFQKRVIQNYIDNSEKFKTFNQNRIKYLQNKTKNIDRNNKAYKGFVKGLTNKDSIQKPIFIPYINAHIDYGKTMKGIIELLEQENGKWTFKNETITFQNQESQVIYEQLLMDAIKDEEIVDKFYDKLLQTM